MLGAYVKCALLPFKMCTANIHLLKAWDLNWMGDANKEQDALLNCVES